MFLQDTNIDILISGVSSSGGYKDESKKLSAVQKDK